MPDQTPFIGGLFTAYEPDPAGKLALGYTDIRFYSAASKGGSYSLAGTATLVDGTCDYSYNDTGAAATDWFYWVLYGATPGEGPASEAMPLGNPRSTRKAIRQAVGARLGLCDVFTLASAADASTAVISDLIDPDASPYTYANRFIRVSGGNAIGQSRRIRAGSTGYTVASGTIVANRATSPSWAQGDEIELWQPRGGRDTSYIVDQAMNDARGALWWEDTHYWTADDNVSVYALPDVVREERIHSVEYAAGAYPDSPDWRDVGYYRVTIDGGTPMIELAPSWPAGTIFRATYNRPGDRMDSDTDYWEAPSLEWCLAEVELQALVRFIAPRGGSEDVSDAARTLATAEQKALEQRRMWQPRTAARVRVQR